MVRLSSVLLFLAGVINLYPAVEIGFASSAKLQAQYGVEISDVNLVIPMRHRGILLGILGSLLVVGAFHRPIRPFALAAALLAMVSFILLALSIGDYNPLIRRVMVVDAVVSVALLAAAGILISQKA